MKFTLATITLGLAALPELAFAAGGFASTCDWYWMERNFLVGNCRKKDGTYMRTRQDMNLCVKNDGGSLTPRDNGHAFDSCSVVGKSGTSVIQAWCSSSEIMSPTDLDLNTFVENRDGYMWCFNHRSAPYSG
ncbi:hypothetical protein QBC42DRAFT_286515 [Cladorrhinum samala]|uniref:Cyanovirin-N domain-containing protein n=1 Tax=Cladorrhinum samala TaxID=585594 RepID=A0AAV9HNK1_9PEZI|nr:hypothetical protein QBC42DRAFT_286515 [Cladorrhinum samala]